jgi:hypothetical protein
MYEESTQLHFAKGVHPWSLSYSTLEQTTRTLIVMICHAARDRDYFGAGDENKQAEKNWNKSKPQLQADTAHSWSEH